MKTLFDAERMSLTDALALTEASLCAYGEQYRHWCLAYSGGKDSTATLAAVAWLIEEGRVPRPQTLTVFYADTRMELPPLHANAMHTLAILQQRGWNARVVQPDMDHRFFVYMFGRGVPPPSNTFRWCTEQLKIVPIGKAIHELASSLVEKPLLLLGLRLGESAARDKRIVDACGKNGGECGQGWFQKRPPSDAADTLAPLLHWRTCHVWDWLKRGPAVVLPSEPNPHVPWTPEWKAALRERAERTRSLRWLPTEIVAEVYDASDEGSEQEIAARTGCVGCNLASQDFSLQRILKKPQWAYLEPLRELKPLYAELKKAHNRLRKDGWETRKDGELVRNPNRLGPLTMEARKWGLYTVLDLQNRVNVARPAGVPEYLLITNAERDRILDLIDANTWPQRWTGEEPRGDELIPEVYRDGSVQDWLFSEEGA